MPSGRAVVRAAVMETSGRSASLVSCAAKQKEQMAAITTEVNLLFIAYISL